MAYNFRRGFVSRADEVTWALGRLPGRTYIHRSFPLRVAGSRDHGQPARWIAKVFDDPEDHDEHGDPSVAVEWTEEVVKETRRTQLKVQIARNAGQVRELVIERISTTGGTPHLEKVLTLKREDAGRLIDVIQALKYIPAEGDESIRLDDQTLRDFSTDPDALVRLYGRDPEKFRDLIRNDASADDVVALAHRKEVVERFRQLLTDDGAFELARAECGGDREKVWQRFLEANPWILGVSLAGQLLRSWDDSKLEQFVVGSSIAGPGKRNDALLRTSGRIRSLVFAEIKHHQTALLGRSEYRPGCWPPSSEVVGGVTQIQQTVDRAVRSIGTRLADLDDEGAETGEATWLIRPRSFLIVGDLDQLRGELGGGVHPAKYQSFELYRRNLYEPEVITFDELLARAEWHVAMAEREDDPSDEDIPSDDDVPF